MANTKTKGVRILRKNRKIPKKNTQTQSQPRKQLLSQVTKTTDSTATPPEPIKREPKIPTFSPLPQKTNYNTKVTMLANKTPGFTISDPLVISQANFPEGRLDGRVLRFNGSSGFIQEKATKLALFFHLSQVNVGGFKKVHPGQYVSFVVGEYNDKKVATNILPKVQAFREATLIPLTHPAQESNNQV